MFIVSRLIIKWTASLVGKDDFGNCYYVSRILRNSLGEAKRYVLYGKNNVDFSNVPPVWNLWLHYLIDLDLFPSGLKSWQKSYQANATGSNLRFVGKSMTLNHQDVYQAWSPNNGTNNK